MLHGDDNASNEDVPNIHFKNMLFCNVFGDNVAMHDFVWGLYKQRYDFTAIG